jgi:hypothetical protein
VVVPMLYVPEDAAGLRICLEVSPMTGGWRLTLIPE